MSERPPAARDSTRTRCHAQHWTDCCLVATRFVIDQTTPVSLAMLRYAIGFICLALAVLLSGEVRIARRRTLAGQLRGRHSR